MNGLGNVLVSLTGLQNHALIVVALLLLGLVAASVMARDISGPAVPGTVPAELVLRVRSWWWMVGLIVLALALGRTAAIVFFGFVSYLTVKEYLSIVPTRQVDRTVLLWVYAAVPIQYWLIWMEWYGIFTIFVPVYMFVLIPTSMVLRGQTEHFLKAVGTLHWGLMLGVYSLGHVAYLLVLPPHEAGAPGSIAAGASLVIALLVLTEANDVFQYIWGKSCGRSKIVPKVSPGKTWEGFLGGLGSTMLLALVLLPFLTPHSGFLALGCGILVAVAGFFGDVTESALKRDLGLKDSSSLIPGHGGILDRVDSLIFTAPLFFHYTRFFHYLPGMPPG